MTFTLLREVRTTVLALICLCATQAASAQDTGAKLSVADLRRIETQVAMPHGTEPIANYFRFYYVKADKPGWIYGMYVAKSNPEVTDRTGEDVLVVNGESDIPAPYDAGCDVVYVSIDVETAKVGAIYCAAELSL